MLFDRLCEKSLYLDYTSLYLFFIGLWQCWKTNSDNDFFSSFSLQDDLNKHCNAMPYLMIVFQADFRECSVGFTGKSELSACDIITVSWPCRVEESGNLVKFAMLLFTIWNVVDSLFIVQNVINVCGKSWTTCYGHKEVVTFFLFCFFVGHLKKGNIEFLKVSSGPADERLTYKEVRKEWPVALLFKWSWVPLI